MSEREEDNGFIWEKHTRYFRMFFHILPNYLQKLDTQRLMLTHFALSGLDLLDQLDVIKDKQQDIINWIYSLQVLPSDQYSLGYCGFRGSPSNGNQCCDDSDSGSPPANAEDCAHLTMTFCALCSLKVLGDPLDRVNKEAIIKGLQYYQKPDGSFTAVHTGGENDMRFVYCACCVCTILDDWSGVNKDTMLSYILASQTYEGGFAQGPGQEAHGGSTFCALASLSMLGALDGLEADRRERVLEWLLRRQQDGFNGRPNKLTDTCYTFWVGASLALLGARDLIDVRRLRAFLKTTESSVVGGFAKSADSDPDPLHTYLGTAGLSIFSEPGVLPIDPELNISQRARNSGHHQST
eukprot:m.38424 g.38424  ORF g.38424 m.38424 type:complete len:352 (-) comp11482_c1_seq1:41-1096(-)